MAPFLRARGGRAPGGVRIVRLGATLGRRSPRLPLPLAACAPVGPDYFRPAAIVSTQYKEIKGWKLASPRDDLAKGEWWRPFRDPELDRLEAQVAVSNQTLKADEANYREALALIAEARAGFIRRSISIPR